MAVLETSISSMLVQLPAGVQKLDLIIFASSNPARAGAMAPCHLGLRAAIYPGASDSALAGGPRRFRLSCQAVHHLITVFGRRLGIRLR